MYVCASVHVCVCANVHVCVHMCMYVWCVCVLHVCVHMYYVCVHACICVCVHVRNSQTKTFPLVCTNIKESLLIKCLIQYH